MKTDDTYCETPRGKLFIRRWLPASGHALAPVILLHDSLGCVELWRNFPAELGKATGRTVIAYDRMGFGRSGSLQGKMPNDFVAQEGKTSFAHVLAAMQIDTFVALGHSVGGGMAVNIAAQYGKRCVALVTESAQSFVEEHTTRGIEQARDFFKEPGQLQRLEKYHGQRAKWVLDAWVSTWLSPEFASWSLRPVLPNVHCPILAIHGTNDEYGSPRHPELIGEFAAGSVQIRLVRDARHVPHREQETYVVQTITDFLRTLP